VEGFRSIFADLKDPRTGNARLHDLHAILVIALCTMLCGGEDCSDMALFGQAKEPFLPQVLPQVLRLEHGIPSHDTVSRVFGLLDPEQFHACFLAFMRPFAEGWPGVVALDGKTLRRSFDRAAGASPLHLVSAWAAEQRLVPGQRGGHGRRHGLSARDRPNDHRSGQRLGAGAQRQPGYAA